MVPLTPTSVPEPQLTVSQVSPAKLLSLVQHRRGPSWVISLKGNKVREMSLFL